MLLLSCSASVHDSASDKWPNQNQGDNFSFYYCSKLLFFQSFIIIVHIMTFLTAVAQLSSEEDCNYPETVYGVLKRQALLCYQSQEDLESQDNPLLEIPIRKVGSKQAKSDE